MRHISLYLALKSCSKGDRSRTRRLLDLLSNPARRTYRLVVEYNYQICISVYGVDSKLFQRCSKTIDQSVWVRCFQKDMLHWLPEKAVHLSLCTSAEKSLLSRYLTTDQGITLEFFTTLPRTRAGLSRLVHLAYWIRENIIQWYDNLRGHKV